MTPRCGLLVLLVLALAAPARGGSAAAQIPPSNKPAKPTPSETAATRTALADAVRHNPGSFEAHHELAAFYLQQRKLEAAIPHLDAAWTIDPANYANGYDLALALLETGKLNRAREQVERMLSAKDTAELLNLLGDIDERADNRVAAAEDVSAGRAHGSDRGAPVRLGQQPGAASRIRFRHRGVRRGRQAASEVGEASCRPGHRCRYLPRAVRGCRQVVLRGCRSRAVRSAPVSVSRRDVRRRPRARRPRSPDASRGSSTAQPRNATGALPLRDEPLEGAGCRLDPAPIRAGWKRTAQTSGRARSQAARRHSSSSGILLSDQQRYKEAILAAAPAARVDPDQAQAHYRLAQAYQRTGQNDAGGEGARDLRTAQGPIPLTRFISF